MRESVCVKASRCVCVCQGVYVIGDVCVRTWVFSVFSVFVCPWLYVWVFVYMHGCIKVFVHLTERGSWGGGSDVLGDVF